MSSVSHSMKRARGMSASCHSAASVPCRDNRVVLRYRDNGDRPSQGRKEVERNRRSSSVSSGSSSSSLSFCCASSASSSCRARVSIASDFADESKIVTNAKVGLGSVDYSKMNSSEVNHHGSLLPGIVFVVDSDDVKQAEAELVLDVDSVLLSRMKTETPVFLLDKDNNSLNGGYEATGINTISNEVTIKRTRTCSPVSRDQYVELFHGLSDVGSKSNSPLSLTRSDLVILSRAFGLFPRLGCTPDCESDQLSSSESTSVSSWASVVKTHNSVESSNNGEHMSNAACTTTPNSECSAVGFSDGFSLGTTDEELQSRRGYSDSNSSSDVLMGAARVVRTLQPIPADYNILNTAVMQFLDFADASMSPVCQTSLPGPYTGNDAYQTFGYLQQLIVNVFPTACVEIYGSLSTQLWLPGESDLDLFINLQRYAIPPMSVLHVAPVPLPPPLQPLNPNIVNMPPNLRDEMVAQEQIRLNEYYHSWNRFAHQLLVQGGDIEVMPLSRAELVVHLTALKTSLEMDPLCKDLKLITRSETPVVKLRAVPGHCQNPHEHEGIPVDISILDGSHGGLKARDYITLAVTRYPYLLRPLILVLKRILREYKLNDTYTGGLGSYALTLLCIFFLQKCGFSFSDSVDLSPVEDVDKDSPVIMKANEVIDRVVGDVQGTVTDVGVLLLRFLKLFSPPEQGGLDLALIGISVNEPLFLHHKPMPLCVRDPIDASNLIGASSFAMKSVQSLFSELYLKLSEQPSSIYDVINWSPFGKQCKPVEEPKKAVVAQGKTGVIKLPALGAPPPPENLALSPRKQKKAVEKDDSSELLPPVLSVKVQSTRVQEKRKVERIQCEVKQQPVVETKVAKPSSWAQIASRTGCRSKRVSPIHRDSVQAAPSPSYAKPVEVKKPYVQRRSRRLFVGNLHYSATEADLEKLRLRFGEFGTVVGVEIEIEHGKMWVEYKGCNQAYAALVKMDRTAFLNRPLFVEYSFRGKRN